MDKLHKIIEQVVEVKIDTPAENASKILKAALEPNEDGFGLFDTLKDHDTFKDFDANWDIEDYEPEDQKIIKGYYKFFKRGENIIAFTINDTDDMSTDDISKFKYCTTYGNSYNGVVLIFHNVPGM
jgi:hypothetical protein